MSVKEATMAVCSFCLRPTTEVKTLVVGPGVFICDGCVALCGQVIETLPRSAARVAPWQQEVTLDGVLATLPRIASRRDPGRTEPGRVGPPARVLGATWARVGEAPGMTRQSAWERFSGEE